MFVQTFVVNISKKLLSFKLKKYGFNNSFMSSSLP